MAGKVTKADLAKIQTWIREGKGDRAREALARLTVRRPPRELAAGLAELAWRCGSPEVGLKLLTPYLHPSPKQPAEPTAEETLEFGACLARTGAHREAARLFARVPVDAHPKALFYRAVPLVATWDYEGSMAPLRRYVDLPGLPAYSRAVGLVNLAAAFVFTGRRKQANFLLQELMHSASVRKLGFMRARVLELKAELLIDEQRWKEALRALDEAARELADQGVMEALHIAKYRVVVEAGIHGPSPACRRQLEHVRALATKRGDWETRRDCDRYDAILWRDEALLRKVYFGTPYPAYRAKLLAEFPIDIPTSWEWRPLPGIPKITLDVAQGKVSPGGGDLGRGSLPHRLVAALTEDFYRPLRLTGLWEAVSPGTLFHPAHSRASLHQGIHRARDLFAELKLPLDIGAGQGWYSLVAKQPVALTLSRATVSADRYDGDRHTLGAAFPDRAFSISEAMRALGKPRRSAFRALESLREDGHVEKRGTGKATRYALKLAG